MKKFLSCIQAWAGVLITLTVMALSGAALAQTPVCTSVQATSSQSATTGTFRVYAYGVTNATAVSFPTWGYDVGGQNDLIFYTGTNAGGGTWYADVVLDYHNFNGQPEYGNFATHVYMYGSGEYCGGANWVRPAPNVAPSVSLSAPSSGATFAPSPSPIVISANASDSDGSINRVEFWLDNAVPLGTAYSAPYSITWGNSQPGNYVIKAIAFDNLGASTTTANVSFSVVAPAPTCTSVQATASQSATTGTFRVYAYGVTNATAVSFPTWGYDVGGQNDLIFYTGTNAGGGTWYADVVLDNHNFNGQPEYGNFATHVYMYGSGEYCSGVNWVRPAPNVAPAVSMTAPGGNYNPGAITLSATATDSDGSISKVEFYVGVVKVAETTSGSGNVFSATWPNALVGVYSVTARAYDNVSAVTVSNAVTVTVVAANVAPAVSMTAPGGNYNPGAITLSATATDSDGSISKVEFYVGVVKVAETTSGSGNVFSATWPNALVGVYSVTARAYDNASAVTVSSAVTVTVVAANVAPAVSMTAPGGNYNPGAIALSATATDSDGSISKVEFYVGAVKVTETTSGSGNVFSATWPNALVGVYSVTAVAYDNLSLATTSNAVTVTVVAANVAPAVTMTAPGGNYNPGAITLSATATDSDGSISKVELYVGVVKVAETMSGSGNVFSATWPNALVGVYSVTARAYDNVNAVTVSNAVTVTVVAANVAPSVSMTAPTANYNPGSITLSATATDSDGSISKVEFYVGVVKVAETMSGSGNVFSATWPNALVGVYSVTARAYDNVSAVTVSNAVTVTVVAAINVPPTVSVTAPVSGTRLPGVIALSANAADSDGTITQVQFFADAVSLGLGTTTGNGVYTGTWANAQVGVYAVTARATDNTGAVTISTPINVTVANNVLPTVSLTAPTATGTYAPGSVTMSATAADSDGTVTKVQFFVGAVNVAESTTNVGGVFTATWTNSLIGLYNVTAKAIDNSLGETISAPVAIVVGARPTVSLTTPANNSTVPSGAVALSVMAADADGTIQRVEFFVRAVNDTVAIKVDTAMTGSGGVYTASWPNALVGNYIVTAVAYDNIGASTTSAPINVTVITNILPTVSVTSPTATGTYAPGSVTMSATAADSDGTVTKVQFFVGAVNVAESTTNVGGTFTATWTNSQIGLYNVTAKAIDNSLGETISAPVAIVVGARPTVSLALPINTVIYAPGAIALRANASDSDGSVQRVEFFVRAVNDTVSINVATAMTATSVTNGVGQYNASWPNALAGSYIITAVAYDNIGASTTSASVTIRVNAAPTASITAPANNAIYTTIPATVVINASAADVDGTITKVEILNNTAVIATLMTAPYTFTWTNVALGSYPIKAKAYDNDGKTTTSATVNVIVNAAPTVTMNGPAASSVIPVGTAITLSADAADSNGTISSVKFYRGGTTLIGTGVRQGTTNTYTYSWTNAAAGSYLVTAIAIDNNTTSTTSAERAFRVNAAPTVSLTAPANNAAYNSPASVTITATAADAGGGTISKVEILNGSTVIATLTTAPYTYVWPNVGGGTYSITAKAYDNDDVTIASAARTIIVNASPTVALTAPASNTAFAMSAPITLSATANDSNGTIASVKFYRGGTTLIGTGVKQGTTNVYTYTWANAANGPYSLTASATDNTGAITVTTATVITVGLVVSITEPPNNTVIVMPAGPLPPVTNVPVTPLPATVPLTAKVMGNASAVNTVKFYKGSVSAVNEIAIGTKQGNTETYNATWSNVEAGSYSIIAQATTSSGTAQGMANTKVDPEMCSGADFTMSEPSMYVTRVYGLPVGTTKFKVYAYNVPAIYADKGTYPNSEIYFNTYWIHPVNGNRDLVSYTGTQIPNTNTWVAEIDLSNHQPPGAQYAEFHTDVSMWKNRSDASTAKGCMGLAWRRNIISITSPTGTGVPGDIDIEATVLDTTGITQLGFYVGEAQVRLVPINAGVNGKYTGVWEGALAGSYLLTVRPFNVNTEIGPRSPTVSFVVDDVPTVSLAAKSAGLGTGIDLKASANAVGGTITKVEIYNRLPSGTYAVAPLATLTAAPFIYRWLNTPVGTHTFQAKLHSTNTLSQTVLTQSTEQTVQIKALTFVADPISVNEPAVIKTWNFANFNDVSDPNPMIVWNRTWDYTPTVMREPLQSGQYIHKAWWCSGYGVGDSIKYAETLGDPQSAGSWGNPTVASTVAFQQVLPAITPPPIMRDANNVEIIPATFDSRNLCDPSVIKVASEYYMYYGAGRHVPHPQKEIPEVKSGDIVITPALPAIPGPDDYTRIGVAKSTDGGQTFQPLLGRRPFIVNYSVRPNDSGEPGDLSYGAGQPSITTAPVIADGIQTWKYFMFYTDTTGPDGSGVYAVRSIDPTFQGDVEQYVMLNGVEKWEKLGPKRKWCKAAMSNPPNPLLPIMDLAGRTRAGTMWLDDSEAVCPETDRTVIAASPNARRVLASLAPLTVANVAETISLDWQFVNLAGSEGFIVARPAERFTKFNYFRFIDDKFVPTIVEGSVEKRFFDGPGLVSNPDRHSVFTSTPTQNTDGSYNFEMKLDFMVGYVDEPTSGFTEGRCHSDFYIGNGNYLDFSTAPLPQRGDNSAPDRNLQGVEYKIAPARGITDSLCTINKLISPWSWDLVYRRSRLKSN